MSIEVTYSEDNASAAEIATHLAACDDDYLPPLSSRVNLEAYAAKLAAKSRRIEAWADGFLVGLVAAYFNVGVNRQAHISNVSVLKRWRGQCIAATLLSRCLDEAFRCGILNISLEVNEANITAINLYQKNGFVENGRNGSFVVMTSKPISNYDNE